MEPARKSLITITFCDRGENHKGMQIIGNPAKSPFTYSRLVEMQKEIEGSEFVDLSREGNEAGVLVVREYCPGHRSLFDQLSSLVWDKTAVMYGRAVNKKARHNLCFADFPQVADIPNGKGTIVDFSSIPELSSLRSELQAIAGVPLVAEGNYYYDMDKCYIGYHGDAERNVVMGVRFGCTMHLKYRWYKSSKPVGDEYTIVLNSGDLYIMSDKAVGTDWRRPSIYTLRHAVNPHMSK